MPLILTIDTATDKASICLALHGAVLQQRVNTQAMDHAAWMHTAMKELMQESGYALPQLNAVAVVAGPGSYTGLRVGMATAKGLCYVLNIPLLSLNTLAVMAYAARNVVSPGMLVCPMLDARRMEVFTALYNDTLHELLPPCAMILDKDSFSEWLTERKILFFGSGSAKWQQLVQHDHAVFDNISYTPQDIAAVAGAAFAQQAFSDLAYSEPVYLKDFYSYPKK